MGVETKVLLRTLSEADAEEFKAFRSGALKTHPDAFGEDHSEFVARSIEDLAQRLKESTESFVIGAFCDTKLIGTIGMYRKGGKKVRHQGIVWGVYVDPSQRGTGLGRKLMEAAIAKSRALEDIEELQLTVVTVNVGAIGLYESLGFKTYGVEPKALKVDNDYYEEALMHLSLK